MKKAKALLSILLVVCMVLSISPAVFAQALSWIYTPTNVTGYIYRFPSTDGILVIPENNGGSNLVNKNGAVISDYEGYYCTSLDHGFLSCYKDGDYNQPGLIDIHKNMIVPFGKYDAISVISNNLLIVSKLRDDYSYEQALIDVTGNQIVPFGKYRFGRYDNNIERIVVSTDNGHGVIDFNGNVVLSPGMYSYIELTSIKDRYIASTETATYLLDNMGNIYATFPSDAYVNVVGKNYISCEIYGSDMESGSSLYDLSGNLLHNGFVYRANKNAFVYEENGKAGLKDAYGNILIQPGLYNDISLSPSSDQYVLVYDEDYNPAYADLYGNLKTTFDNTIDYIEIIDDKYVLKSHNNYSGESLSDINGNVIIPYEEGNEIFVNHLIDMVALKKADGIVRFANITNTNSISVLINGNAVTFDQPPVIENGRTLVPVRAIFEALGADVKWDDITKTATSTLPGVATVKITIDSNVMYVNDTPVTLDVPAKILNSRTLVPVRAVSEAFKCNVDWDQNTQTVIITK